MSKLFLIMISLLITGCATIDTPLTKGKQEVIMNSKTKEARVYPDNNDMHACGEFSVLLKGTFAEFADLRVVDAKTLDICSAKQEALSKYIDELKQKDK